MRFLALLLFLPSWLAVAETNEQYWSAWRREAVEVRKCTDAARVGKFLNDSLNALGNAERSEAYAEVLETIILATPKCFLNAAAQLKRISCKRAIAFYVDGAIYHEPKELHAALKSTGIKITACYGS